MIGFVQGIRDGDCSGVAAADGIPVADSPTQWAIGASEARYLIGGAVGGLGGAAIGSANEKKQQQQYYGPQPGYPQQPGYGPAPRY